MANRAHWKPEWKEALVKFAMVEPRMTNGQIAIELNRLFDHERTFTDHQVKARRLNLVGASDAKRKRAPAKPRRPGPCAERRAAPDAAKMLRARKDAVAKERMTVDLFAPDLSGLPGRRLANLKPGRCKFEISGSHNRHAYRFCGNPVVPLPPYAYCSHHAQLAYQMPQPKRKR